ncbi:2-keto-4-pentenoate hydratase [Streptomyces sp. NPDC002701]|uniref:2-keto-4-pentenoate hydratase n=1 Tax=Streptomyces sp. NPDC002701 TaxID=3364661 RepID=UPI0036783034
MTVSTDDHDVLDALRQLLRAWISGRPGPPVRGLLPPGDLDAAYAVQSAWAAAHEGTGARVIGRKIGLTNPLVQVQLGVDQPDFGVLFDDMARRDGELLDITRLMQPKIEAEIAFVLARDLDIPAVGPDEVRAATGHVVAALEIVDSRIRGWDISIVDTIADNASSGLFVLGSQPRALDGLDLRGCAMTMRRDGHVVSTGTGADCLGDPLRAVAWLATTARAHGRPLRAGDIVMSGALGPMAEVTAGDTFQAEITGLGTVGTTFTGGPS